MTATRTKPARSLRVIDVPAAGTAYVTLAVGQSADDYSFTRTGPDAYAVRKLATGALYETDTWNGTCDCPAGRFGNGKVCRHVAAGRALERRKVL